VVDLNTQNPSILQRLRRFEFIRGRARRFSNWMRYRDIESRVDAAAGSSCRRIFTFTSRAELAQLYRLASLAPKNTDALEIGSYLGASAGYIATAMKHRKGRLYCVDTWHNETMLDGERDTFAEFRNNTAKVSDVIVPIRKRSEDLQPGDLASKIGFVFIDGDHSYEACKRDFDIVSPWLPENGIVAFHDAIYPLTPANHPGVQRVIGIALSTGEWQFGDRVDSLCWIKRAPGWLGEARQ